MVSSTRSRSGVRSRSGRVLFVVVALIGAATTAWAEHGTVSRIPPAFPHGIVGFGCTQEDIPGIEIVLTTQPWKGDGNPPVPYLRIEAAGLATERPGEVTLSPLRRDPTQRSLARAEFHDKHDQSDWLSGSVRIDRLVPGQPVAGGYAVCLGDGSCATGDFRAAWRPGPARCG